MKPSTDDSARVYRLDLQYCGADFAGWQSQPAGTGVQDHVEKALATLLRHPVRVIGASRTDTGVHAEHQVAIFRTPVAFDELRWLKSLHGLLPPTIGTSSVRPVDAAFHPIYSARAKAYRYRLWLGATRNPIVAPYCWQIFPDLSLPLLRQAAPAFIGRHDFTSFCAADSSAKSKVRTVLDLQIHASGPMVEIWLLGQGFLKQMVRIMVGTLVDIGLGKRPTTAVAELLAAQDRRLASRTAPAQGLSLVEIFYDDIPTLGELRTRLNTGYAVRVAMDRETQTNPSKGD